MPATERSQGLWSEESGKQALRSSECFELYKTGNYSRKDLEKLGCEKDISWETEERVCDENGVRRVVCVTKRVTEKMLEHVLSNPLYCQSRRIKGKVVRIENAKWPALTSYETFMACQKMKGIRAAKSHVNLSSKITKPLMQLMKCQVCEHAITGEVKRKASGKTYIYYRCANSRCSQHRIYTEQKELLQQFMIAFEPFARFTPKATSAFVKLIRERAKDIGLHSVQEVNKLREKQAQLNQRLREVEELHRQGILPPKELVSIKETRRQEIEDAEVEINSHHSLLS